MRSTTLWLTRDGYTEVTYQNIGTEVAEGVDLNFNYLLGLGNSGYLAMDLMGSYLLQSRFSNPLVDYDCTGYFGVQCGQPQSALAPPLSRHLGDQFPVQPLACVALCRRRPRSMTPARTRSWRTPNSWPSGRPARSTPIPHYNWFDLAASYTFRNGIKLTIGVNNILDEEPPLYAGGYATSYRSARAVRLFECAVQLLATQHRVRSLIG